MIETKDLRKLEKAMTRSIFRGVFWAIILGSIVLSVLGTFVWLFVMVNLPQL